MATKLVKFLAVARVTAGQTAEEGTNEAELKPILACAAADAKDPDLKAYKKRVQMVLKKAADKMQEGKRIKLSSQKKPDNGQEEETYELYIMSFKVSQTPQPENATSLAFFAIVDKQFGVGQSIGRLYDEFKTQFFQMFDTKTIMTAKANGPIQKKSQTMLLGLCTKFGSNNVLAASQKVEEVKAVMQQNIEIAISNGQALEDIEEKSEKLKGASDEYNRKAKDVRRAACLDNYKAKAIVAAIVLLIIAVVAVVIYLATKPKKVATP